MSITTKNPFQNLEDFEIACRIIGQLIVKQIDQTFCGNDDICFAFVLYDTKGSGFSTCMTNTDLEDVCDVINQTRNRTSKALKSSPSTN